MQRITITQFAYSPAAQDFVGTVTGVIDYDGREVHLRHGGEAWLQLRVPDPTTGESLGVEDDPQRWVELFPSFVGGGDTDVTVASFIQGERPAMHDVTPAIAALAAAVHAE
ncbi:hypothetical protein [Solirubrobacter soli]|uniref:hypothetical protein n=1 Tax=Solirubrobacter soli TaxID=363832 RepID=UPI000415D766|nr:hypothetical protein [Solirubrobacter soli]